MKREGKELEDWAVQQLEEVGYFVLRDGSTDHQAQKIVAALKERMPEAGLIAELPISGGPFVIYDHKHRSAPNSKQRELMAAAAMKE